MSDTTRPRYGYAPTAAFAATRASAEQRRTRETAGAVTSNSGGRSSLSRHLFRRLTTLLRRASS